MTIAGPLGGLVYDHCWATSGFREPLGGLVYDHRPATARFVTIALPLIYIRVDAAKNNYNERFLVGWVPQKNNDYI